MTKWWVSLWWYHTCMSWYLVLIHRPPFPPMPHSSAPLQVFFFSPEVIPTSFLSQIVHYFLHFPPPLRSLPPLSWALFLISWCTHTCTCIVCIVSNLCSGSVVKNTLCAILRTRVCIPATTEPDRFPAHTCNPSSRGQGWRQEACWNLLHSSPDENERASASGRNLG